jgi:translation initiation factor RLI1
MLDQAGLRALTEVIDYNYGGSDGYYKVSSKLSENNLVMQYKAIFQFADNNTLRLQTIKLEKESEDTIKEVVKRAQGAYDDVAKTDLKSRLVSDSDDVQMVGTSIYSPRRTAYYTRIMMYELG